MIGADGLHSEVRKLVFGPQNQFEKYLGYKVAAFEVEGDRPRDELVYCCTRKCINRWTLHDARRP